VAHLEIPAADREQRQIPYLHILIDRTATHAPLAHQLCSVWRHISIPALTPDLARPARPCAPRAAASPCTR
jgi:hypothetical protein